MNHGRPGRSEASEELGSVTVMKCNALLLIIIVLIHDLFVHSYEVTKGLLCKELPYSLISIQVCGFRINILRMFVLVLQRLFILSSCCLFVFCVYI